MSVMKDKMIELQKKAQEAQNLRNKLLSDAEKQREELLKITGAISVLSELVSKEQTENAKEVTQTVNFKPKSTKKKNTRAKTTRTKS